MPKYGYLVVEGPHDVEFVYRLLSPFGLKRVQWQKELDRFLLRLVPKEYPPGGDLQKRMPVPLFLQSQSHAIAVQSAIGDSRLAETVEESAAEIDFPQLTGVGVILDTDSEIPAVQRFAAVKHAMLAKGFVFPDRAGEVLAGPPRFGVFVLPDNSSPGNLEDLLIECAQEVYPQLLSSARTHVAAAMTDATLLKGDGEDLTRNQVRNKAIVGAIATVLRPGKAVQASIQDNRWFRDANLNLPRVKSVQSFLANLFDLTAPEMKS